MNLQVKALKKNGRGYWINIYRGGNIMNIYRFNKVLFKGNINIKFFLFCLRRNFKLIKYLFINLYNIFLSIFIKSKKDLYKKHK